MHQMALEWIPVKYLTLHLKMAFLNGVEIHHSTESIKSGWAILNYVHSGIEYCYSVTTPVILSLE